MELDLLFCYILLVNYFPKKNYLNNKQQYYKYMSITTIVIISINSIIAITTIFSATFSVYCYHRRRENSIILTHKSQQIIIYIPEDDLNEIIVDP